MGASTQRSCGSLYPKMGWESLPKDVVDASWQIERSCRVKERVEAKLDRVGTKFTWSGGQGFCLVYKDGDKVVMRSWSDLSYLVEFSCVKESYEGANVGATVPNVKLSTRINLDPAKSRMTPSVDA
ncbi:hypothetical protein Tco_0194235 [Tanacetum coccineum]